MVTDLRKIDAEEAWDSDFTVFGNNDLNFGPIMVQLFVPSVPLCGLVSHPYRVVSISYRRVFHFHGGNTGSNPVGDAKESRS